MSIVAYSANTIAIAKQEIFWYESGSSCLILYC